MKEIRIREKKEDFTFLDEVNKLGELKMDTHLN